jgi:hypothetical protein
MTRKFEFQIGETYTRRKISKELGGSMVSYLPRVGDTVVCGCFTRDLNPDVPSKISFGAGPEVEHAAEVLAVQAEAIPVFIKKCSNAWEYKGLFRATKLSKDKALVVRESKKAIRPVVGVIFLDEVK